MNEADELADEIVATINKALAPFLSRIKGLEDRPIEKGERGADAPAVTDEQLQPLIERFMLANADRFRGLQGDKGEAGLDGKDGAGINGKDGANGRDAMSMEVLSVLDRERRYERGTAIAHAGGLILARRATDPVPLGSRLDDSGWLVIHNGIKSVQSQVDGDGRMVTRTMTLTDGTEVVEVEKRDVILDRGVFRAEQAYEKGDHVSYGGSGWIAQRSTDIGRPGLPDSGWRLSTKAGRDGKDGKHGDKGDKGDKGRDLL